MNIGNTALRNPVMLAPMAGYTDAPMRLLCHRYGAGMSYTEVANAAGLLHHSKLTWHLLETHPDEGPVAAHLYGSDPGTLADAAHRVEQLNRFLSIDINAGCPVRKIVAKGAGAALMRSPELIYDIISAVCAAVHLPVTLKTRSGLNADRITIHEICQAAAEAGAAAIAIHARTADHQHRGPADWELLQKVKASSPIPVIGNGGIASAEDVPRMFRETGVDGVMIGRAAVGQPWIFEQANHLLSGNPVGIYSLDAIEQAICTQLAWLREHKEKEQRLRRRSTLSADQAAALHFRPRLVQFLRGMKHWSDIRTRLNTISTCDEIRQLASTVIERQQSA